MVVWNETEDKQKQIIGKVFDSVTCMVAFGKLDARRAQQHVQFEPVKPNYRSGHPESYLFL